MTPYPTEPLSIHANYRVTFELFCLCESNGVVLQVIDRVPSAEESISKNDERTDWCWEIHTHESRDTRARDLKDIVVSGDLEIVSTELEGQAWEAVSLCAVDGVLSVPALLSTNLLVEELGELRWESNEGSSGVKNGASVVHGSLLLSELDSVELNLPVGLSAEWEFDELARVVRLIDTTEGNLRLVVGVTEVEREDSLIELALVDKVVEWWDNLVDGDGVVSKTHDTVEATESKSQTWLLSSLSEVLLFDGEVANGDGVLGDETAQAARAVLDVEACSVGLVCAGGAGIVGLVEIASNRAALLGWNPNCFKISPLLILPKGPGFRVG